MKQFSYTIHDPMGIHARPAGMLAKLAKSFDDTLLAVTKGGKTVKLTQLMQLMSLGIRHGDEITVSAEGAHEDEAIAAAEKFFQENL